jgi:hypothetical protein
MLLHAGILSLGAVNAHKNENAGKDIQHKELDDTAGAAALGSMITYLPLLGIAWCSLGEFYKPGASESCLIFAIFAGAAVAGAIGSAITNALQSNPDARISVGHTTSVTAGGGGGLESFLYVLASGVIYCCFGRPGNTGSPEGLNRPTR